jgi:hypothetical protein
VRGDDPSDRIGCKLLVKEGELRRSLFDASLEINKTPFLTNDLELQLFLPIPCSAKMRYSVRTLWIWTLAVATFALFRSRVNSNRRR